MTMDAGYVLPEGRTSLRGVTRTFFSFMDKPRISRVLFGQKKVATLRRPPGSVRAR